MNISFQERLNLYEIAQETIGFMMAMRSDAIYKEKKKPNPDVFKIAQLDKEFDLLNDELHDLKIEDDEKIKRVLDEYCPIVKADFQRHKSVNA